MSVKTLRNWTRTAIIAGALALPGLAIDASATEALRAERRAA